MENRKPISKPDIEIETKKPISKPNLETRKPISKPDIEIETRTDSKTETREELKERLRQKIQSKKGTRSKTTLNVDKVLANNPTGVDLSFAKKLIQNLEKDELSSAIQMAASKVAGTGMGTTGTGMGTRKIRKQIEKMLEK